MQNNNCDGSGPCDMGEVRVLPTGGQGNAILCHRCFTREIQYRMDRNRNLSKGNAMTSPTYAQQCAAEYTPGPWAWQLFGDTYSLTAQHGRREQIISAIPHGTMKYPVVAMNLNGKLCDVDPKHPNAKLIAAAPDLLEFVRHSLNVFEAWKQDANPHGDLKRGESADYDAACFMAGKASEIISKATL